MYVSSSSFTGRAALIRLIRGVSSGSRSLLMVVALAFATAGGCATQASSSGQGQSEDVSSQSMISSGLTPESTPTDVARVVLESVVGDGSGSINHLMAEKKIAVDIQAITGGRKNFEGFSNDAASKAAALIASSLRSLEAGSHEIESESVNGEKATVIISGRKFGQANQQILYLVREDGFWKLVPSHR